MAFKISNENIIDDSRNIVDAIKEKSLALRETTQMKPLEIKCSGCGHDYEQVFTLNVSDFFD